MTSKANIKEILSEVFKQERSLIITLPSTNDWSVYEKELRMVANFKNTLKFKVHDFPRGVHKGDKCYLVYNNEIVGWMEIVGFSETEYTCADSNQEFAGKFVERSGPLHPIEPKLPYKDFNGIRYFTYDEYLKIHNI